MLTHCGIRNEFESADSNSHKSSGEIACEKMAENEIDTKENQDEDVTDVLKLRNNLVDYIKYDKDLMHLVFREMDYLGNKFVLKLELKENWENTIQNCILLYSIIHQSLKVYNKQIKQIKGQDLAKLIALLQMITSLLTRTIQTSVHDIENSKQLLDAYNGIVHFLLEIWYEFDKNNEM